MQGVTLQLGLERSMPLQQIEGGGIKEHRGYLGVITITSIACRWRVWPSGVAVTPR